MGKTPNQNPAFVFAILLLTFCFSCQTRPTYDSIIRNGLVYDGTGSAPVKTDIGIRGDTIAFIGNLSGEKAKNEVTPRVWPLALALSICKASP